MPRKPVPKGAAIRSAVILGAFCFVTTSPLFADPSNIPFRLHDHLIVVEGSIEELEGLNLVIDTGTTFTLISKRIAGKLQIRAGMTTVLSWGKKCRVRTAVLERVRIGATVFDDVEVRVGDLLVAKGIQIDALIGLDLLKRTNVTIDYENRVLTFGAQLQFESLSAFYPNLPFLPIRLKVQEKLLTLILDTGAPRLIFFEDEVRDQFDIIRTKEREQIGHVAGNLTLRKIRVTRTSLAETHMETITAYLLDVPSGIYGGVDGIFSPTSLHLKRLHLDFQSNRISWEL